MCLDWGKCVMCVCLDRGKCVCVFGQGVSVRVHYSGFQFIFNETGRCFSCRALCERRRPVLLKMDWKPLRRCSGHAH